jgi:hypothetical protein
VKQDFAGAIHDTDVHGLFVQVHAAKILGIDGDEIHDSLQS